MALSSLLLEVGGRYSEAQLVVLVLAVFVVAVALLSYFVVAPEYEKRLEKHYAAAYAAHLERDAAATLALSCSSSVSSSSTATTSDSPSSSNISDHYNTVAAQRYLALTRKKITKHRSLGRWDIEAASSSDDDAYDHYAQRLLHHAHDASESDDERSLTTDLLATTPAAVATGLDGAPRSMNAALRQTLTEAQRQMLARRRKSESDALKHANVHRAEMLRRRVQLKKLEEEIKGAIQEHDAATSSASQSAGGSASAPSSSRGGVTDALVLTPDKLQMLQAHPADCAVELAVLAAPDASMRHEELKRALQTLHDVLALYLSTDHRDMHKLTVFCNALLQHDGLNHLRALEIALDSDVRTLATSIIEMAVPAIWH